MREELLSYYERELTFLRQSGAEFARQYPKIASRLQLEADRCDDPHTERLLEGFALLAARVHLKLEDEFPEISTALLDILYPHYLRPMPSMTVVEFEVDPTQGKLSTSLPVPRDSVLYSKAQVDGAACKFRTSYDTVIWPISVAEAQWRAADRLGLPNRTGDAAGGIRLLIRCGPDLTFGELGLDSLRFYLNGESKLVHTLYELLCNNCIEILVRDPQRKDANAVVLSRDNIVPIGFGEQESILPYPRRSFDGYRLLQEYFTFPEKFFFVELKGLEQLGTSGFGQEAEVLFLISRFEKNDRQSMLEVGVSPSTFRLNCSPIVNLYAQTAEPILLDQTRPEYPVVPDVRRAAGTEVFSIDKVVCSNPRSREVITFEPFYAFRHTAAPPDKQPTFWHGSRRAAGFRGDERTEVHISLVDTSGRTVHPDADTLTVFCTCTNADLPSRLPIGNRPGDFEMEGMSAVQRVVALRKLTPTLRPPTGKRALWRLISHLSLNYLSLVEQGKEALQQILQLYNFSDSVSAHNQIAGITQLQSRQTFAPVRSDIGVNSARGTRVEIALDEDQFVGGGVYLFASVLEHFLGMYVSINSFSQLVASTPQRKEVLREWPPRAGRLPLL